jgi:hypothetical protein
MDFDDSSDEFAQWTVVMPNDWNAGTVTAVFYWLADSAVGNDVVWGFQGRSYGDGEAIDQAWGVAQTVTDTNTGQNQVNISGTTAAITLAGTPAASEMVQFRAYRDADAGGDTLSGDARLIAIRVTFTRT